MDVGADCRPHVPVARAGVVDADRLARLPAEELDDGEARRLPGQIPERDVDRRVATCLHPGAPGSHVLLDGDPEAVDGRRVLPEEAGRGGLVEVGGDLVSPEEGLAEAGQAGVRVEAHEA